MFPITPQVQAAERLFQAYLQTLADQEVSRHEHAKRVADAYTAYQDAKQAAADAFGAESQHFADTFCQLTDEPVAAYGVAYFASAQ